MTTRQDVEQFLDRNPGCAALDMARGLNRPLRTVQRHLTILVRSGQAHISGYEPHDHGSGKPATLYTAGPGDNESPPKPTRAQRRRYAAGWLRQWRRQERVVAKAQGMGPFGVLAPQLDTTRKNK